MTAKAKRGKKPALVVPQSVEAADGLIGKFGEHQRAIAAIDLQLAVDTALIKKAAERKAEAHKAGIETIFAQLEAYGAANRVELTKNDRTKTAVLPSGKIGWRFNPPKVVIAKGMAGAVEKWLVSARAKLRKRFLRISYDVNKQAILDAPALAAEVPHVSILRDVEVFFVEPVSLELAPAEGGAA